MFEPALSPVSQSGSAGVMGWLGAKMQSWELLPELFISLRASLKNFSEGARETPSASDPACSPQRQHQPLPGAPAACRGWDHPWAPRRWQCRGKESSHAVCGRPWVSPGTGDVSCEPFGSRLAEAAFAWQPPSCSERRRTQPVPAVGQSPGSCGKVLGSAEPPCMWLHK